MIKPLAITGIGQSRFVGTRNEVSLQELIFECASNALADAGIDRKAIDSVVLSASDLVDGRGIASMSSAAAAGAYMKHETRTTNDGLYALILASLEILAGRSRVSLVMSWNKSSEGDWLAASPTAFEPLYARPAGLDGPTMLGLEASAMLLDSQVDHATADRAVARNRRNASANSRIGMSSASKAHAANVAPWPLMGADIPWPGDGAYGIVLADPQYVAPKKRPYAFVRGFAWGTGTGNPAERPSAVDCLAATAERAYRDAGIGSLDAIDLIELVSRSSFEEVAVLSGLVKPLGGNANALINDGETERDGDLPVNPSGGSSGLYLTQSAGLAAAVEVSRQLSSKAGPVQIPGAKTGIAHGQSGPALQSNAVAILSATAGAD